VNFNIEYLPRTTIKGQALADFVVKFANFFEIDILPTKEAWTVHVDESTNKKNSGARVVVKTPKGKEIGYAI
jgi:hypothetical protein